MKRSFYQAVYQVVLMIPPGRVTTYGRIANALGSPRASRAVGYALFNTPDGLELPWHRVVNGRGEVSARGGGERPLRQRALLESEGIAFNDDGRIDLRKNCWYPPPCEELWAEQPK